MFPHTSYISVTDQFCGAGGSSLGAKLAGCEVVLAMNHWELAIETHNTNFPDTTHVLADIQQANPRNYPATDILVTSPECVNHSLAKGKKRKNLGQLELFGDALFSPAEERSRATMWDVPRFAAYHNYRIVIVENVIDARRWQWFDVWILAMTRLDYEFEIVYFNSQFAPPTPQSRDRMYIVFWKRGNRKPDLDIQPAAWCPKCDRQVAAVQSWKPDGPEWGKYGQQYGYCCPHCNQEVRPQYAPAYTAIDWSLPVVQIGQRRKPLKPRTIERIEYGLKKYSQVVTVPLSHSHSGPRRAHSIEDPIPTQTTRQTLGLAVPPFLMHYYTRTNAHSPVDKPMPTCTGDPRFALVTPPLLASYYGSKNVRPVTEPMGTVTTLDRHALIQPVESLKIDECGFRMIQPHEIQAAMAFPKDYVVLGNKRQRVRQLGNAVTPPVMTMLIQRCVETLS